MTIGERRRRPKFRWLLRDDFTDTRAALAINGTWATDGFNLRTVVDTESKLTIAGGALVCAGGKAIPGWGDPGLWYPAQVRVAGKILLAKKVQSSGDSGFGWDTNQSGVPVSLIETYTTLFDVGVACGVFAAGTTYEFAIILRATGVQYFVKGGAYVPRRLVWMNLANNTSPMYPNFGNYSAVYTGSYILIPDNLLYLASPLLSDSFARADSVLGSTDGAGHAETSGVGSGGSGGAWVFDSGVWTVAANAAVGAPTLGAELATGNLVVGNWYSITATQANYFYTGCAISDSFRAAATTALDANNKVKLITLSSLFATRDLGTSNVFADCEVKTLTTGTQCGMVLRLDSAASPANFVLVYFDGAGNIKVVECVAGVYTQLASVASAFTTGDVLRATVDGANYRVYKIATSGTGTATLISAGTTNILTGNSHGAFSTYSGDAIERMVVYPTGAGGEHEGLQQIAEAT